MTAFASSKLGSMTLEAAVLPCSPEKVHFRMLQNLRHIYETRGEDERLVAVLDQALAATLSASQRSNLNRHRDAATDRLRQKSSSLQAEL